VPDAGDRTDTAAIGETETNQEQQSGKSLQHQDSPGQ
jgi:hypothetical protein